MRLKIQAACGCHTGKIRKTNEDNFYFDNRCLEPKNKGLHHPITKDGHLSNGLLYAVFDGMGGENYGEHASYAAAHQLQSYTRTLSDYWTPETKYLERLTIQLNRAVVDIQAELRTQKMGTTMVSLYYRGRYVYVCNVGDSRAYRLRDSELLQLSEDHIEYHPARENKKAPLTRYLGMDVEEVLVEPHITKGEVKRGDWYLLCSDGLTDMLTNAEISEILIQCKNAERCVQKLIYTALEHGGRDNITVIICAII